MCGGFGCWLKGEGGVDGFFFFSSSTSFSIFLFIKDDLSGEMRDEG